MWVRCWAFSAFMWRPGVRIHRNPIGVRNQTMLAGIVTPENLPDEFIDAPSALPEMDGRCMAALDSPRRRVLPLGGFDHQSAP